METLKQKAGRVAIATPREIGSFYLNPRTRKHMLGQGKFNNGEKYSQMIACMNHQNEHWLTYQVEVVGKCEYEVLNIYSADSLYHYARPHLLDQYIELKIFLVLNFLKLTEEQKKK
jgi:hypothetical protein